MSKITDRKAKRIERVRNEIMNAAIEIISTKGFRNTSTKEIASRADLAEGTLYNYFKNKDDILMSIAERYVTKKRNLDLNTDVDSFEEFVVNIYSQNAVKDSEILMKDREILKALLPEFLTDKTLGKLYYERIVLPYLRSIEESLLILQNRGLIGNFDIRVLSRMFYANLIGFAVLDINGDDFVANATPDIRKESGAVLINVLSKGMSSD